MKSVGNTNVKRTSSPPPSPPSTKSQKTGAPNTVAQTPQHPASASNFQPPTSNFKGTGNPAGASSGAPSGTASSGGLTAQLNAARGADPKDTFSIHANRMLMRGAGEPGPKIASFAENMLTDKFESKMFDGKHSVAKDLNSGTKWLEDNNKSTSFNASASKPLQNLVREQRDGFVELAKSSPEGKEAAGKFLTEALRTSNFAEHDSRFVGECVSMFKDMGINIIGDPKNCTENATFGGLGYAGGAVIMDFTQV